MAERDRRPMFAPVVGVGLAGAGLLAVAGGRAWMTPSVPDTLPGEWSIAWDSTAPLASALGLVLLAAWGVLLVTRGAVRRGIALVAVVAAGAAVVVVVGGWWWVPGHLADQLERLGIASDRLETSPTAWYAAATLAAIASALTSVLAFRWVSAWPEMGSRYDAPGATAPPAAEDASQLDLWRAMDQGHDPTTPGRE
jgi:Tryptophan-associated transmembrane protein (Trp_oprn_chp)